MIRSVFKLTSLVGVVVLLGEMTNASFLQASPRTPTPVQKTIRLGSGFGRSLAGTAYGPYREGSAEHANLSYLNDTKKNLDAEAAQATQKELMGFQYQLLSDDEVTSYRDLYNARQRDADLRERHRLGYTSQEHVPETIRQRQEELRSKMVGQVSAHNQKIYLKRIRRAAENDPNLSVMRTPAMILVGAYAISQGEPVKWDVSESTKLTARTKVQKTEGYLDLTTKVVNSSFAYAGRVADVAPWGGIPGRTDERMSLGLSKDLTWIETTSSLIYGTSSNTVRAALSRPMFTPHLTAIVGTTRTVGQQRLSVRSDESVEFRYKITF